MLKSLRKKPAHPQSPPAPQLTVSSETAMKALYDYDAKSNHEFSFRTGDEFIVCSDDMDSGSGGSSASLNSYNIKHWVRVHRPNESDWKWVPRNFFSKASPIDNHSRNQKSPQSSVKTKSHKKGQSSSDALNIILGYSKEASEQQTLQKPGKKNGLFWPAKVLFDFKGLSEDELSVAQGQQLRVIAQHPRGWYLCKFENNPQVIGLVPKSYIKLFINDESKALEIPTVSDWKLGFQGQYEQHDEKKREHMRKLTKEIDLAQQHHDSTPFLPGSTEIGRVRRHSLETHAVITASVSGWRENGDAIQFKVEVIRVGGKNHIIWRSFDDFLMLHRRLMHLFPEDAMIAGNDKKTGQPKRALPFLASPLPSDFKISENMIKQRRENLDEYVWKLVTSGQIPERIRRSRAVIEFFAPWSEDARDPTGLNLESPFNNENIPSPLSLRSQKSPSKKNLKAVSVPATPVTAPMRPNRTLSSAVSPAFPTPNRFATPMRSEASLYINDRDPSMMDSTPNRTFTKHSSASTPRLKILQAQVLTDTGSSSSAHSPDSHHSDLESPRNEKFTLMQHKFMNYSTPDLLNATKQPQMEMLNDRVPKRSLMKTWNNQNASRSTPHLLNTLETRGDTLSSLRPSPFLKLKVVSRIPTNPYADKTKHSVDDFEEQRISYFKVVRSLPLQVLRQKLLDSMGVSADRELFAKCDVDGMDKHDDTAISLTAVSTDKDLLDLMNRCKRTMTLFA